MAAELLVELQESSRDHGQLQFGELICAEREGRAWLGLVGHQAVLSLRTSRWPWREVAARRESRWKRGYIPQVATDRVEGNLVELVSPPELGLREAIVVDGPEGRFAVVIADIEPDKSDVF